jgi:hypothetical protein
MHVSIDPRAVLFCGACLLVGRLASAQTEYSVTDLGRASDMPVPPPTCCTDKMLMNGKGQLAMERVTGSMGRFDVLYWEPGMSAPLLIDGHLDDTLHLTGLSSNGYVVGTSDGGVAVPFRWSRGGGRVALCCADSWLPLAVNASGIVVGTNVSGGYRAVVWSNGPNAIYLDDLDIAGKSAWTFELATTISDDGKIGGIGRVATSSGVESHYFVLTPTGSGGGAPLDRSDWTVSATEFAAGDPPRNAIDGDLNTRFSTGRGQHDSQGVLVTWPGDRTIRRIRFEVGPSTNDYPRTCGIWVKDVADRVTRINCAADSAGVVDVSFSPLPVQRIEIWQWGTAPWWWSIAELNVFD